MKEGYNAARCDDDAYGSFTLGLYFEKHHKTFAFP
jgi:hypothetical protein